MSTSCRKFLVVTPEKVLLDIKTLDYFHENDTMGNLRDYEVPPRQESTAYSPAGPTPVLEEVELANGATGDFQPGILTLGLLVFVACLLGDMYSA